MHNFFALRAKRRPKHRVAENRKILAEPARCRLAGGFQTAPRKRPGCSILPCAAEKHPCRALRFSRPPCRNNSSGGCFRQCARRATTPCRAHCNRPAHAPSLRKIPARGCRRHEGFGEIPFRRQNPAHRFKFPNNPRFFPLRMNSHLMPVKFFTISGVRSVEQLSSTTTRSGRSVCRATDSRVCAMNGSPLKTGMTVRIFDFTRASLS